MSSPMYDALSKKYQDLSSTPGMTDEEEGSYETPKYSQAENTFINNQMANGKMKKVPNADVNDEDDK